MKHEIYLFCCGSKNLRRTVLCFYIYVGTIGITQVDIRSQTADGAPATLDSVEYSVI